jgi:phosphoribosylformylglycinamidine cyclo-ligase
MMGDIAAGLYRGAEMAEVSIPGGELAQVKEMIRGAGREGTAFDLVGMAVGIVPVDRINTGRHVKPGDALVGLASSGLHSNGYTLARRVLLAHGGLALDAVAPPLTRALGLEMLEPTRIYVREAMAMIDEGLSVRALANITGDGLLNLNRIDAECGFKIDFLPEPPPIFPLIQKTGEITDAEMFRVFNMGIGFCVVVPEAEVERAVEIAKRFGTTAWRIGTAVADKQRKIEIAPKKLVGIDDKFA